MHRMEKNYTEYKVIFVCIFAHVCMTHGDREEEMRTFYFEHIKLSQITIQLWENRMDWYGH